MALDGLTMHAICRELQSILPARINRIHEVSDTEILFQFRHNGTRQSLIISCHSSYNRIHLTNRTYPTPEVPSNFVMVLRKYLESGTIVSIEQIGLDRCLVFHIRSISETGFEAVYQLYVELMGKYANAILVGPDNRILHAMKLIPPYENTKRIIQIGAPFVLTDPLPGRVSPFDMDTIDPNRSLLEQFDGFSPLLETEVRYRMAHGECFRAIMDEIRSSSMLYVYPNEKTPLFHIIPLTHLSSLPQIYPLFTGLDEVFYRREEHDRIRQQTGDLFKLVRREIKKLNIKLSKLEDSLEQANNSGPWKEKGQLIYGHLDEIHKGMTSVDLPSYETGALVHIPLDPKLDAKGNARKCFQKYTKGRNGQTYIAQQIEKANQELSYFTGLEYQLSTANFTDAAEIKQDLINNGYLKPGRMTPRRRHKSSEPQYRRFAIPDGSICYGKNNLQNEYLTWKKARKKDLWFHVKDAPGSHVILMKDNPEETDIRLAAMVAAYHSCLRESSSIPVNWCPVKNLKKIPGARTGLVELGNYRTIYIDIVPELLKDDPEGPEHEN